MCDLENVLWTKIRKNGTLKELERVHGWLFHPTVVFPWSPFLRAHLPQLCYPDKTEEAHFPKYMEKLQVSQRVAASSLLQIHEARAFSLLLDWQLCLFSA